MAKLYLKMWFNNKKTKEIWYNYFKIWGVFMLKIDFHIHTISTLKDTDFEFNINILNKYINEMSLDCIAITNHNTFDRKQFENISKCVNAKVYPGMEIDIENSHLLLICDICDMDVLELASSKLEKMILDENSYITFEEFENLFPDYNNYILIPHYKKKPRMQQSTINKFKGLIKCGEVPNSKKYSVIVKDKQSLNPVVFSDFRPGSGEPIPIRYTYVNCINDGFSNIKCAIEDRSKVAVTKKNKIEEIEYLPNGATISNRLNVILGTRTSGKTYNIEKIKEAFDKDSCLYIPQFSLIGDAEESKFEDLIKKECNSISDTYYAKFKPLVNKLLSIDIETEEINLEEQLNSLLDYAEKANIDAFAKTKIFSEIEFNPDTSNVASEIIKSLVTIYNNSWHRDIINKYIEKDNLKILIKELIEKRKEEKKQIVLEKCSNEAIKKIKDALNKESSANTPDSMDLITIFKHKKIIEKSKDVFKTIKKERVVDTQNLQLFNININSKEYDNVKEIKDNLNTRSALKPIFDNYYKDNNLYKYVKELEDIGLSRNDICKAIICIKYDVKNQIGEEPSGGEKAEFNLLKEIDNAYKYDVLLIDEPEASFDNPFISRNIVDIIKNIADKTTVCITTHNSTLAMMLNPDKIIFTENNEGNHKIFYGTMGDKVFKSIDGEEIISYDKILEVLEAGKTIYREKGQIYESFRDK